MIFIRCSTHCQENKKTFERKSLGFFSGSFFRWSWDNISLFEWRGNDNLAKSFPCMTRIQVWSATLGLMPKNTSFGVLKPRYFLGLLFNLQRGHNGVTHFHIFTHFWPFLTPISNILHFTFYILPFAIYHLPYTEYFNDIPLANIAKFNTDKLDRNNQYLKEYELLRGAHAD